jgi:two-component system CheB/CheR fusion protein
MKDKDKAQGQLMEELKNLRKRVAEFESIATERKREEETAKRLATVVRDSNDAIIIQDIDGRITAWNRGAELMYGYSEAEALGMNIEHLSPPDKVAEQREFTRRLIAGEAVTSFETSG